MSFILAEEIYIFFPVFLEFFSLFFWFAWVPYQKFGILFIFMSHCLSACHRCPRRRRHYQCGADNAIPPPPAWDSTLHLRQKPLLLLVLLVLLIRLHTSSELNWMVRHQVLGVIYSLQHNRNIISCSFSHVPLNRVAFHHTHLGCLRAYFSLSFATFPLEELFHL